MSDDIIYIHSISQLHKALGLPEPLHPLISVLHLKDFKFPEFSIGRKTVSDFYLISKKDASCGLKYGRHYYDFEEGLLTFTAPGQVLTPTGSNESADGWMMFFHPDLLRGYDLGKRISDYTFFSYEVHEALHMSKREENMIDDCVSKIEYEYQSNIDRHSQALFVSNLEVLLNYSNRFYERQFHTRKNQNQDVLSKVESLLKDYYREGKQSERGTPSIQYIADGVNLSPNYLSDLLKKETGKNTRDHINGFLIERAKDLLLSSQENVSTIAFDLGFNYPHYFSRLFKQQTGMTPKEYRSIDLN